MDRASIKSMFADGTMQTMGTNGAILMPSVLTDEMDIHYEKYANYFDNEKIYLKLMKEVLVNKGLAGRSFTTIFKLLRHQWLNYSKTPHFDDLFLNDAVYAKGSRTVLKSKLKSLGFIDGAGCFTIQAFSEYVQLYDTHNNTKQKYVCIKHDVVINPDVVIDKSFDYDNTLDTIRKNPTDISYYFPDDLKGSAERLSYSNTDTLQIIKLNHVGGNPRTAIPLMFHYACKCGNEVDLPYDVKDIICDNEECNDGKLIRSKKGDIFYAGYASQVIADDFNNLPILSLTPIPLGEFNAAVFLRQNKAGYYLFMIAIDDIIIESTDVVIQDNRHAIWQLIDIIDQQHEERLKRIIGMEWYKAAVLLSYLANMQRYTSMNVLAVGKGGTGKTSVPRFYLSTLTQQYKLQDALSLSSPGLYGSTSQVKIGESVVTIPEAGLLSRYQMVIVDEVYLKGNKILPVMRSLLRASTINKEVAGNRTSMIKNACVVGTSNPVVEVLIAQSQWMDRWINANEEGRHTAMTEEFAHAAMVEEWVKRDLDWHTGQPFPDMDRWMLIFFIEKEDTKLQKYHLNPTDMMISDIELSKKFYDQSLHDYFILCSGIKVDYEKHSDRILKFIEDIRKHDTIHSDRIGQDITLMLQLSAQINGRCDLTDEDFDFVRELWSKTCDWIDVNELSHGGGNKTYLAADWTIERIKKEIHARMKRFEGSQKFWMTSRGFALITAELEKIGAPADLIDSTIERYKANPNQ